nr:LOW QUALITY PROTEIN: serine/threonine-protein kinase ULK1 [Loxodonta africana]
MPQGNPTTTTTTTDGPLAGPQPSPLVTCSDKHDLLLCSAICPNGILLSGRLRPGVAWHIPLSCLRLHLSWTFSALTSDLGTVQSRPVMSRLSQKDDVVFGSRLWAQHLERAAGVRGPDVLLGTLRLSVHQALSVRTNGFLKSGVARHKPAHAHGDLVLSFPAKDLIGQGGFEVVIKERHREVRPGTGRGLGRRPGPPARRAEPGRPGAPSPPARAWAWAAASRPGASGSAWGTRAFGFQKHDLEVAVKCINKKNLAKSQTLLGKEIKILKELKHENIVALYDFQEMANSVYLVMEYCNGGDLADYLHTMRTLSEDTIRLFLQQIAGAMRLLHSKDIIHRDLKPQNILLSNPGGRRANPNNIRVKIADFGFARYLQSNMMAATLCGSPMYMAPEVIMSQHYDGKADLWSIGTIVYQCLTGKAPFQVSAAGVLLPANPALLTPAPSIPRETSAPLRQLLLALLQRNHKDRMDFDEFFHHPFLDASASIKKSPPVPVPSYPSSGSGSSSSSSSTSHLASPPSLGEIQQLQKTLTSPADAAAFLQGSRDSGGSSKDSSCDTDDFVMVPAQFPGDLGAEAASAKPLPDSLLCSGSSLVASAGLESHGRTPSPSPPYSGSPSPSGRAGPSSSRYGVSVPIPVPTQVHNYQRIEQNLQLPAQYMAPRSTAIRRSDSTSPLGFTRASPSPPSHAEHGAALARRFSLGGARPYTPSPQVGTIPEGPGLSGAPSPQGAETRGGKFPRPGSSVPEHSPRAAGLGCRLHSAPNLSDLHVVCPKLPKPPTDPLGTAFGPPQASPPLSACRPLRGSPKLPDFLQRSPLPPILGSPTKASPSFDFPKTPSSQNLLALLARQGVMVAPPRNRTLPDLTDGGPYQAQPLGPGLRPPEEAKGPFGRSLSTGRLTDLLLKAAFGTQAPDSGSTDSLQEKPMEIAPSTGFGGNLHSGARAGGASSPSPVVFTVGSPPSGTTPPQGPRTRMFSVGSSGSLSSAGSSSGRHLLPGACNEAAAPEPPAPGHCYSYVDPIAANLEGVVTFEAPDLPEETLMEQEHTETLHGLRFTLAFVQHVLEIAALKGSAGEVAGSPDYQLQESLVADQISLLSREWSFAEQLVLYLKVAELLSAGLQTAIDQIRAGKLCLSSTVKQVVRKLNELYKSSVVSCQDLSLRLQRFFLDKQRLMDRVHSITAERLIFSHAVQTVQSAALDEMFHRREDCVQRYHKALLLMEGLQQILVDQADVENIAKCKLCIERRLSALLTGLCA